MKFYKAKLKTAGKTAEQVLASYDMGDKPPADEVEAIINSYNLVDGIVLSVLGPTITGSYAPAGWRKEDDDKIRDFVYQAEQDAYFGCYVNDREEFLKDWNSEEYDPGGSLTFSVEDVEILEELG